jgi:hypothetical protein
MEGGDVDEGDEGWQNEPAAAYRVASTHLRTQAGNDRDRMAMEMWEAYVAHPRYQG